MTFWGVLQTKLYVPAGRWKVKPPEGSLMAWATTLEPDETVTGQSAARLAVERLPTVYRGTAVHVDLTGEGAVSVLGARRDWHAHHSQAKHDGDTHPGLLG